jgi:alpha-mannosidase
MKLDTIYLIHHTHTDVGYTNDQPIFWEMQPRFIDDALDLIDRYAGNPPESRFRWTVETTCGIDAWLKTATSGEIDRLIAAEKGGYLEVMAMFANITPLLDTYQLIESLKPVHRLRREFGLDIRYAMNCDVNGQNWVLPDVLLDLGIEGFSMAVNHHFGGPPEPRPSVFLWQAPSGRKLPTHNGWQYSKANDFGLSADSDEVFLEWLPKIEEYLTQTGYPLPYLILEGYHPYGDNGTAWGTFAEFARRWNESGREPRIICATPRMFWERLRGDQANLPTLRGDWTDYWNFGCISAARETTISRTSRPRLFRADALYSLVKSLPEAKIQNSSTAATKYSDRANTLYREAAWQALNLYGEHTWGADTASNEPELEDSLAMDNYKKNTAYTARSLSLLLERDALADFSHFIPRSDATDLLIFNPLPWARTIGGPIPKNLLISRGLGEDTSSSRHFLGRNAQPTDFWTGRSETGFHGGVGWTLSPVKVPALGYTVVSWDALTDMASAIEGDETMVENHRYRVTFDREKGGICSLWDKELEHEWVDPTAGYPLHGFVHEEVADHETSEPRKLLCTVNWTAQTETQRGWHPDWLANRTSPVKVLLHRTYRLPFASVVEQVLEHPKVGKLCQRVLLPDEGDAIEFLSEWQMGTEIHPEATYLLFPFNIPGAQARFDTGGVPIRPHLDQIPGTCRDYFTVQGWVDFNNEEMGVTIAIPENPMVQLGDFHFAHNQSEVHLERAMFLGWVTNNYWETNFPGMQPGTVTARYHILLYRGKFDEGRAHRFGSEAAQSRPVIQHLGEQPAEKLLPPSGTLLNLPEAPVLSLSLRKEPEKGMLLTLFNASDNPQVAVVKSGIIRILAASRCDIFGNPLESIEVKDGALKVAIEPRRITTISLER